MSIIRQSASVNRHSITFSENLRGQSFLFDQTGRSRQGGARMKLRAAKTNRAEDVIYRLEFFRMESLRSVF